MIYLVLLDIIPGIISLLFGTMSTSTIAAPRFNESFESFTAGKTQWRPWLWLQAFANLFSSSTCAASFNPRLEAYTSNHKNGTNRKLEYGWNTEQWE